MLTGGRSIGLWVAGRLLQGLSASVVWTVAFALLVDTVGNDRLGEAIGYVGIGMSLGMLLGPTLGGLIFHGGGFYTVFGVIFGLIAVDIFLRFLVIEKGNVENLTETETETAAADYQTNDNSQEPQSSNMEDRESNTATRDTNYPARSRPTTVILLTSSRFAVVLFGYLALAIILSSFDSVLPIFVSTRFGWSTIGEGLVFLPLLIPAFLEPLVGKIIDKYKKAPRFMASCAFLLAVPFYVLLRLVNGNSIRQEVLLCALLALIGVTLALSLPALMTEISNVITAKETKTPGLFGERGALAQGYGLLNCAYALGSLLGPIWAGFVRDKFGWKAMTWTLALLSGVTSIPLFAFIGGWIGKEDLCIKRRVQHQDIPEYSNHASQAS